MDDEVGHRFKEDHSVRNVILVAVVTILLIGLGEWLDLPERVVYGIIGALAGCAIGFLIGYIAGNKR